MISVQIPESLEKRFDKLAAQKNCDRETYIRKVLEDCLEDYLAEEEDHAIALQRLSDIDSGKVKPVSLEEMEQRVFYAADR